MKPEAVQPRTVKQDRAARSINRIFEAAAGEFGGKGFEGARMDEIALRAGVNKATIYYHVGGKAALYEAILSDVLGRTADAIEESVGKHGTSEEKLQAIVTTIGKTINRQTHLPSIILRELAAAGTNVSGEALLQMGRIVGTLRAVLEEGVEGGRFRRVNPMIIHLMMMGGMMLHKVGEPLRKRVAKIAGIGAAGHPEQSTEEAAEHIADLFIRALKVD